MIKIKIFRWEDGPESSRCALDIIPSVLIKGRQKWIYDYLLQKRRRQLMMEAEIGAMLFEGGGWSQKPGNTDGH